MNCELCNVNEPLSAYRSELGWLLVCAGCNPRTQGAFFLSLVPIPRKSANFYRIAELFNAITLQYRLASAEPPGTKWGVAKCSERP